MKLICLRYYAGETMVAMTNEEQAAYPEVGDVINFFLPKGRELVVRVRERVWFHSTQAGKSHLLNLHCTELKVPAQTKEQIRRRKRPKPRRKH